MINYDLIESILDKFIPKNILSKFVSKNQDFKECEEYVANVKTNNDKNDLYHALKTIKIKNTSLLSYCIYTDINKAKQNLYLKLISAINNL